MNISLNEAVLKTFDGHPLKQGHFLKRYLLLLLWSSAADPPIPKSCGGGENPARDTL